jgi:hypothetical protein
MRFGFTFPSWIYDAQRFDYCARSLASLARTDVSGLDGPIPFVAVIKPTPEPWDSAAQVEQAVLPFEKVVIPQPTDNETGDGASFWGYDYLVRHFPEVTHMACISNDWLFSKNWLHALKALIERHPHAKAWWVYRSAYEEFHKTLCIEPPDVLVRSISGGGCFSREAYDGMLYNYGSWRRVPPRVANCHLDENSGTLGVVLVNGQGYDLPKGTIYPGTHFTTLHGLSFDLYDPFIRPGERWVTESSYILNIGVQGINQNPSQPEVAVNFVGE